MIPNMCYNINLYFIFVILLPKKAALKGMSSTLIGVVFSEFELIIVFMSPLYGAFVSTEYNIEYCNSFK